MLKYAAMDSSAKVSLHNLSSFLDSAKSYLSETVALKANEIDKSPDALLEALQGLGNLDLLALRVSGKMGW